jgi:CRISPR-associated protein Cmr6
MVFERPNRPGKQPPTTRPNPAIQRSGSGQPQRSTSGASSGASGGGRGSDGGQGGSYGGGRGNGSDRGEPSPWLIEPGFAPDPTASFVEYLRWMRAPDSEYKDPTKVQILQMAEEGANYRDRLQRLTERTKLIAGVGNYFQVKCTWRIRVGGHRGPESILLPAFDALGMPYIPSSTLRGVARTQAIRELIEKEGCNWKEADRTVAEWFGHLDVKKENHAGKIIFLDAYPIAVQSEVAGGLAVDMANNIWNWEANDTLKYSPNPNPFFSLKKPTFLIGIRRASQCNEEEFGLVRDQVEAWLVKGLQAGIGSQVNTGYGSLVQARQKASQGFFSVSFGLEGQLIHGRQKFTQWNWNDRRSEWQMRGNPEAEVRSVAFKSMLRYWFRSFAQGVLPSREVKRLEALCFGAINPQTRGWVAVQILDGRLIQQEARPNQQGRNEPCGEQSGTLQLSYSSEAPAAKQREVAELFKNLTWLMFHLGGIGQGARRPCYSRQKRENGRAPWWRGSTLVPDSEDIFWDLPDTIQELQKLFQQRLQSFYGALGKLAEKSVNPKQPLTLGQVSRDRWTEAVDANCKIIVCAGEEDFGKPYALGLLHCQDFKVQNRQGNLDYDGNLCGKVQGGVKPSPVWIANLGDYQVVTVFGATQDPRKRYIQSLREAIQIFPLI